MTTLTPTPEAKALLNTYITRQHQALIDHLRAKADPRHTIHQDLITLTLENIGQFTITAADYWALLDEHTHAIR